MIRITQLNIYPVKGLRGISLDSADVLATGLRFDRQWMVVDDKNKFLSQREHEGMALIQVQVSSQGLVLSCAGHNSLDVPIADGPRRLVKIWKDHVEGVDQGDPAAQWLQSVLNLDDIRLMHFAPDAQRAVRPDYLNGAPAHVGFADAFPFLFANEQTLRALNTHFEKPLPMNRFRPNITLSGLMALEEHAIATLEHENGLVFALPEPCKRCKVTTIDQDTGVAAADQEPVRTLLKLNPFDDKRGGYFGQNGILLAGEGAILNVGDTLQIG